MKPKFNYGDVVAFQFNEEVYQGRIEIIDVGGAFGYDQTTYDILVEGDDICLYKHVREGTLTLISRSSNE